MRVTQVANLVPAIDKARLYRGKGGEVLREAVSKLIGAMAYTHLPMNNTQHNKVRGPIVTHTHTHTHMLCQQCATQTCSFVCGMPSLSVYAHQCLL